jgi:hypothetical protein
LLFLGGGGVFDESVFDILWGKESPGRSSVQKVVYTAYTNYEWLSLFLFFHSEKILLLNQFKFKIKKSFESAHQHFPTSTNAFSESKNFFYHFNGGFFF